MVNRGQSEVLAQEYSRRKLRRCNNRRVHAAPSDLHKPRVRVCNLTTPGNQTELKIGLVKTPTRRVDRGFALLLIALLHAALARYRPGDSSLGSPRGARVGPVTLHWAHHAGLVSRTDRKAGQATRRARLILARGFLIPPGRGRSRAAWACRWPSTRKGRPQTHPRSAAQTCGEGQPAGGIYRASPRMPMAVRSWADGSILARRLGICEYSRTRCARRTETGSRKATRVNARAAHRLEPCAACSPEVGNTQHAGGTYINEPMCIYIQCSQRGVITLLRGLLMLARGRITVAPAV